MLMSIESYVAVALKVWVLKLMFAVQPVAPWTNTYESSAEVIAEESIHNPLFEGEDGRKTAAILVALGKFEGALKPDAKGDCDKTDEKTGMCVKGSKPHSFCMFQVNESNFARMGVTQDQMVTDFRVCTKTALRLAHESFRSCRSLPLEDRLNAYAEGRGGCRPSVVKGKHRMNYGMHLFKTSSELPNIADVIFADPVTKIAEN